MKTLCEKLRDKHGHLVKCDFCGKKKTFNENWRMTGDHMVTCPDCVDIPLSKNAVLVSI